MKAVKCLLGVQMSVFIINILMLVAMLRKQKCPNHIAHLNLCIADLLYAVGGIPGVAAVLKDKDIDYDAHTQNFYERNAVLAKVIIGVISGLQYTVFLSLTPIVYDRIIAVMKPGFYQTVRHRRLTKLAVVLCWVFGFGFPAISLAIYPLMKYHELVYQPSYYLMIILLIFCFLPFVFTVIGMSVVIALLVKKRPNNINLIITVVKAILIIFFFTVSWLPWSMNVLVSKQVLQNSVSENISKITLLYVNTITDPLLYLLPNKLIRRVVHEFLKDNPDNSQLVIANHGVEYSTRSYAKNTASLPSYSSGKHKSTYV